MLAPQEMIDFDNLSGNLLTAVNTEEQGIGTDTEPFTGSYTPPETEKSEPSSEEIEAAVEDFIAEALETPEQEPMVNASRGINAYDIGMGRKK
ncbi:MAG TPA: hypothetical protein VMY99_02630 [Nevskiaceae bacterium]|nr:hypothetical protein [Nevskiaceae bacterium]